MCKFLGYIIGLEGLDMDQGKLDGAVTWPRPTSVKEVQCFIGFANFYRRFAALLIALLKNKPRKLNWTSEAENTFTTIKQAFIMAPILNHPDPERPFIVEVDASKTGVGAMLLQ